MRSSIFQRGGLPLGVVLAGLLGLGGATLLVLAGSASTPLAGRAYGWRGVEVRMISRGVADDAPAAPRRPALARIRRVPAEPASPPPPVEDDVPAKPIAVHPRRVLELALDRLACLGDHEPARTDREGCREILGAQALETPALPAPIDPDKRADYDAAVQAQAPRRALVPLSARGAGGAFAADDRPRPGKSPRVGCALRFGLNAGETPRASSGALDAGPCFIRTPG